MCMPRVFTASVLGMSVAADDAMHFLAIGDWGGNSDSSPTTAAERDNAVGMAAIAKSLGGIRMVLAEGDNFYGSGIHGDEHCQRFVDGFESAFPQDELQVPFYAIAGNHDHGGNVSAQVAYTQDSERWTYPDFWYSFTENFTTPDGTTVVTEVVHIDTVTISGMSDEDPDIAIFHPHEMEARADEQMQWLEATLAASTADYLWIGGHYPIYSQCNHGPTDKLISGVLPLMYQYNVNGYLAGHDHCLGHYTQDNMAFVVSGAGKTCCYGPNHIDDDRNAGTLQFRMDSGETHGAHAGFASFSVNATETIITYYNQDGDVLYVADAVRPRSKTPSPVPAPVPVVPVPPPTPPAPSPAPAGWECQANMRSDLGGDSNLGHTGDDISTCTDSCVDTEGCVAVKWHKTDNHCHIKVGSFVHDDWVTSLASDGDWDSCFKTAAALSIV